MRNIPRERGGLPNFTTCRTSSRCIFPANAGVILQIRPAKERYCNIPRERGGHPAVVARRPVSFAYSPRARGSSRECQTAFMSKYILPANAGVFLIQTEEATLNKHIPRECGGQPHDVVGAVEVSIYFPANAGVTLLYIVSTDIRVSYSPRMRGSTYGGVSGCRYANISLHMQGCPSLRR